MRASIEQLDQAWNVLRQRWDATRGVWDDPVVRDFEKMYLAPLESAVLGLRGEARRLGHVLAKARSAVK